MHYSFSIYYIWQKIIFQQDSMNFELACFWICLFLHKLNGIKWRTGTCFSGSRFNPKMLKRLHGWMFCIFSFMTHILLTCSCVLVALNGVAFLCSSLSVFFSGYVASHIPVFTGDVRRCLDEGTSGESRQLKRRVCAKSNKGNPTQTNEHYSLTCPYQSSLSNGKFLNKFTVH